MGKRQVKKFIAHIITVNAQYKILLVTLACFSILIPKEAWRLCMELDKRDL